MDKRAAAYFAKFDQPVSELVRIGLERDKRLSRAQVELAVEILFKKIQGGFEIKPIDQPRWIWREAAKLTVSATESARSVTADVELEVALARCKELELEVSNLEFIVQRLTKPSVFKRLWGFLTKKRYIRNAFKRSKVQSS